MAEATENGTPNRSVPPTPGTPGTPGAPLFAGGRVDSLSYDRKSMPRCNECLPVDYSWAGPRTCLTDFPRPDVSLTRKLGAEFVGTFILIFGATAAPIVNQKYNGAETLIGNAACAGLAVMIVILSTGHISGAHLNPSLTIAFATLRHFPWVQVPAYIAAQVSASICASFALKGIYHPFLSGGVTVPSVSTTQAFFIEFVITFNLLFVVTAVATDTRAAIEWGINESGENIRARGGRGELQADMDIPGGPDSRCNHWRGRLHCGEAEGRERGNGAPGAEFPPLNPNAMVR
ncbi:probable aquaporin NIP5-1 isoform X2 [Ananas comosus]|uniref:Probable aquaporin NIP5-1 isoform X2 n=1 Tax=Ananas comosus TaxID=4615 RepID=A0A6P5EPW7_ANACO|nr:probable aquaporin NIP5-1 isoform X2 [Ananas comosus]